MPGASPTDDVLTEPAGDLPAEAGKRLSRRRIAIIAAIAVLVLAGIGTTVFFLTNGDDKPSANSSGAGPAGTAPDGKPSGSTLAAPQAPGPGAAAEKGNAKQIAEQAVKAYNTHDLQAMKKISCDPAAVPDALLPETKVELAAEPELTGDTGTVELKVILGDQETTTPLPLRKQNGIWCVD
jgi:hypothetical protein